MVPVGDAGASSKFARRGLELESERHLALAWRSAIDAPGFCTTLRTMIVDCHMHTFLCGHAVGSPTDYVRAAAERGIGMVTFTCHAPMENEEIFRGRGIRMTMAELPEYRDLVAEAAHFGREIGVEVRYGIEGEYYQDERKLRGLWDLLETEPFDFVLGSLHHQLPGMKAWLLDQGGPDEIATAYFHLVAKALRTKRYDSIAHPDLIRIYGTVPPFEPETQEGPIRAMLEAAVESDTCLEVNTSGLIKQLYQLHPAPSILRWAAEIGVKLTLGSDSHHPDHVGQHFPEVIALLKDCGFTSVHHFKGRKRIVEGL